MAHDDVAALALIYARGLLDKAAAVKDGSLLPTQRSALRSSMSVDIRKLCDMAFPAARTPLVSERAAEWAAERGIDLTRQTWDSQPSFDPGRAAVHYEHTTPVSAIRDRVLEAASVLEVVAVLDEMVQVAWVTKEENDRLTALGYSSKRPDPLASYREAGIVLMSEPAVQAAQVAADEAMLDADEGVGVPDVWRWVGDVLGEEVVTAQELHEPGCGSSRGEDCSCRLGRHLAEDSTTKVRVLDMLNRRGDGAAVYEAACLLAFPFRHRPGWKQEWMP